jgi:nitrate/nitrite-specific signal transduction histidine kinase
VEVDARVEGDWLEIRVRDDGPSRTKPSRRPGLGLGLRIMRAMAETRLEELPSGGFQVSLRFPCNTEA